MSYRKGCDVSALQGIVPWAKVRESGITHAYLRCAIGNEPRGDVRFAENVMRAKAEGIAVGPYFFLYPLPHLDPRDQARYHYKLAEGCGTRVGEMLPAIDFEWPEPEKWVDEAGQKVLKNLWAKWGCSPSQLCDWFEVYADELDDLVGGKCPVYSYRYFLKRVEAHRRPGLASRPLWLADYTYAGKWPTEEQAAAIKPPAPWTSIAMVQHDGNNGLRLPSGADADFNLVLDDSSLLVRVSDPEAEETVEPAFEWTIDPLAARDDAIRLVLDEDIARYRRERIDDMLTSPT